MQHSFSITKEEGDCHTAENSFERHIERKAQSLLRILLIESQSCITCSKKIVVEKNTFSKHDSMLFLQLLLCFFKHTTKPSAIFDAYSNDE